MQKYIQQDDEGTCTHCAVQRVVETIHGYNGSEPWGCRTLNYLGLPLLDIFVARGLKKEIGYLVDGDREAVLGVVESERSPQP